jgi:hypothetical protein
MPPRSSDELETLLDNLERVLKDPDIGAELSARAVNVSLALTLADGLRAYIQGQKERAVLDLGTATEEIAARMARKGGPSS